MWSSSNDFGVGETKMSIINNINNDNYNTNDTIPYHARENSLPFSYGQITKTPTLLRSVARPSNCYRNNIKDDFDFNCNINLSSEQKITFSGSGGGGGGSGSSIDSADINFIYTLPDGNKTQKLNLNGSDKYVNFDNTNKLMYIEQNDENRRVCNNSGSNINNISETAPDTRSIRNSSNNEIHSNTMIKTQPRLTSPLLVRKTLNTNSNNITTLNNSSKSPTRSTTNTIANTYHYSYGNKGDSFDKFNINGNISDYRDNYDQYSINATSNYTKANEVARKTPTRYEFEELLRDRREKVFNEYSSSNYDLSLTSSPKTSPVPPTRRFTNGTVQLPSTLINSTRQSYLSKNYGRSHSSQSRNYNYDFEFNLNLDDNDDVDVDVNDSLYSIRRQKTLERSPQRQPQKQLGRPKYETNDIPLTSTYVDHSFNTQNSASPTKNYANKNYAIRTTNDINKTNPYSVRESATTAFDIYSKQSHDERKHRLPQADSTTMTTMTASNSLQSKRSNYATYGSNDHVYGYDHTNTDAIMERKSSPIYATSTKKVTNTYQRSVTAPASIIYPNSSANATTSTVTDYSTGAVISRPETPAFPVTPRTPYGGQIMNGMSNASLNKINMYQQHQQMRGRQLQHNQSRNQQPNELQSYSVETVYGTNYRPSLNSSLSKCSSEPQDVAPHLVKFAKDSSKFWYKPNLSREEAISLLVNAPPGTFVVRDSTTYKNAYGLVLRVAHAPSGTATTGKPDELVRHFLIEPTTRGVRLKGCANEPVFTSLSALVYEHSINQLALPCLLQIPERDIAPPLMEPTPAQKQLMTQGAACNVLWLFSCETESLTGDEAIRKAIRQMYAQSTPPTPTEVHFKVTQQGITLTDNTRKKFFRNHYTADTISYCAIDPDHRLWTMQEHGSDNKTVVGALKKTMFAFVARCSPSSKDNQCHVFCDLAINQPASAIVSFVNKTLPTEKRKNYVL